MCPRCEDKLFNVKGEAGDTKTKKKKENGRYNYWKLCVEALIEPNLQINTLDLLLCVSLHADSVRNFFLN